jgi:hypothetical protein
MEEVGKALEHGWTWRDTDDTGIATDPGSQTTELGEDGGHSYQKVTRGGVPVAFIKADDQGAREFLLPPASEPSFVG